MKVAVLLFYCWMMLGRSTARRACPTNCRLRLLRN